MSLINSVLVELEQRRALPTGPQSGVLHGLDPVSERFFEREQRSGREKVPLIAVCLLALLAAALAFNFYRPGPLQFQEKRSAVAPPTAQTPAPAAIRAPASSREVDRSETVAATPGVLTALSLKMDGYLRSVVPATSAATSVADAAAPAAAEAGQATMVSSLVARKSSRGVDLELFLSGTADYSVYPLSQPDRVVIEIDGADLAGDLTPQGLSSDTITGYRPRHEDGRAVIVLDLAVPASITDSKLQPRADGYVLDVELELTRPSPEQSAVVEKSATPSMEISAAPLASAPGGNVKSGADTSAEFQHATRMYQDGRVAEGLARMVEALARNPDDAAGRTLLVNKLIEQRDYSRAVALLDAGLARDPGRWQWTMLKAQVLNSQNNAPLAVALLDANLAAANLAPEYLELHAGLLQKVGEHAAAAEHYQRLVQIDPGRGLWWLGLGISREAQARRDEARQAFDMALRDPALRPDLRKFAQSRLQSLNQS